LTAAADASDFDAVLDGFVERFLGRCPPVLNGQIEQLRALDTLTANSAAGARQGLVYRLEAGASTETIEIYGRRISFPSRAGQAVRFALNHARFLVRDLPGNLDDAGKITLVRRLIREGLVRAFLD
jgi:hypothetical protein